MNMILVIPHSRGKLIPFRLFRLGLGLRTAFSGKPKDKERVKVSPHGEALAVPPRARQGKRLKGRLWFQQVRPRSM